MKQLTVLIFGLFLFSLANVGFCQKPGELYITPYDNSGQPVFFCNGILQNEIQTSYGIANLYYQTDPNFHVDSIIYVCDKSVFQYTQKLDSFTLGGVGLYYGPVYAPSKIGTDTLRIVGFYGPYTTTALIICHAEASPEIGFFGWTRTALNFGGGFTDNNLNPQIRTDTLHDEMGGGFPYHPSQTPQSPGINTFVELLSCGEVTIDSIYPVGDFSEFEFINLPKVPVTLKDNDSLEISYLFTPHVVGKFPHYLVFHTTGGKYLVWSFEYKVTGINSVEDNPAISDNFEVFPNPTTNILKVKIKGEAIAYLTLSITDALGVTVKRINTIAPQFQSTDSGVEFECDVSELAAGAYTIVYSTPLRIQSKRLIIVR